MIQKTVRIGSSIGVIIPKKTLKERGVNLGDQIEFNFNPVKKLNPQEAKIAKLTLDFIERYRSDLEALANK